jgi:dephospho-CoA kinase
MRRFLAENASKDVVFVSVPLLFEAGFDKEFDKIIFVDADPAIRQQRLIQRDRLTAAEARARMQAQSPAASKIAQSDFVVSNNGSVDELYQQLDVVVARL